LKIKGIIERETPETGITARGKAGNKFCITRYVDPLGMETYILENTPRGQKIYIGRYLLDRFRASLKNLLDGKIKVEEGDELDIKIFFGEDCYFRVRNDKLREGWICIQDLKPKADSSSILELSESSLKALVGLLYNEKLQHPSEVLDRIISYHQLFQFSFADSGKSIKSDFRTRKNLLYSIEKFTPAIEKMSNWNAHLDDEEHEGGGRAKKDDKENVDFVSKLGAKSQNKAYQIDYETLFKKSGGSPTTAETKPKKKRRSKGKDYFELPIMATVVKEYKTTPFVCELSGDDRIEYEETFPISKNGSFFLGIEIIDAVFKRNGVMRTFKFPLYYLKVDVTESGRTIYINPSQGGKIYFNHIAIANLVSEFGARTGQGDPVDNFFQKIATQVFEKDGAFDRLRLFRNLTLDDDVFRSTRKILFGEPKSDDRGLFKELKLLGIEVDLETTHLYKIEESESLISQYLEKDLEYIKNLAYDSQNKFYQTLLGKFLIPEVSTKSNLKTFCESPLSPGRVTKPMESLLDQLNEHEILLLEGPPGTGKTFSILNLLIHCVCTDKKVLIVSDNIGAVHALTEKIQEYLLGQDRESIENRRLNSLWQNAIKVVDEIPNEDDLTTWSQNTIRVEAEVKKENFNTSIKIIDKKIKDKTKKIQKIMERKLAGHKDEKMLVAKKNFHATTEKHMEGFLHMLE